MTFEIYENRFKNKKQRFRWRLRAKNHLILAGSSEGYLRKRDCMKVVLDLINHMEPFVINDLTTNKRK